MLKKIIIAATLGVISFVSMFTFTFLKGKAKLAEQQAKQKAEMAKVQAAQELNENQVTAKGDSNKKKQNELALQEEQLKKLIFNVREKIKEYNEKTQSLVVKEERLKTTYDMIKKDLENLNNLRTELATTVSDLKQKQQQLENSMVEIDQVEQENMVGLAATYDKMDPASAAKIMTNMSKVTDSKKGSDINDAVKILYYMTERTKAKVLAELSNSQPEIAAHFCRQLKKVVEKAQ